MRSQPFVLAFTLLSATLSLTLVHTQTRRPLRSDPSVQCLDCADWNRPHQPFRIFGNTYYVGVAGLSSILITSDQGHILLDGALPQSAPLIEANIRTLGFSIEDVELILNSHSHFDHAGGIDALQRRSGATVAASTAAAKAIRQGHPTPDDPQYESGLNPAFRYPAVKATVRTIADRETLRVGALAVTPHFTPGHTAGGTTWTWQSCEGSRCLNMVYADSLTPVADEGFRYTGDASHPSLVETFRRSIAVVEQLACDILIAPHPGLVDLDGKLARRGKSPASDPFVDSAACRAYAQAARKRLDDRIASEK